MENHKIKICFVASVDITLKFLLFSQLKFLKNKDYIVSAVCSPGKWVESIEKEGIEIKKITIKRKIFSPFSDLISLFQLFFYFRKEKFDIVHTHTPKPGLLGQLAAKMAGVPIVVNTIHGFYFQKKDSRLKRFFFILIEKIAAKCSDLIFFVNREDMETAIEEKICSPDLRRYFGGGIDIERFNPERFSEEFILSRKKELGIENKKVIGMVGRFVKEKGYLDLFEAFKIVKNKNPGVVLLLVAPLDKAKVDALNYSILKDYRIKKEIILFGDKGEISNMEEIYSLMDIFVLPSYREGLPYSIMEASASGILVVATNIRGCREAVEDGITGKLIPVGDTQKLAEAITYLLSNPDKAKQMGEAGREKAEKEFDEKLVFGRIKKEYERLIKEKI